MTCGECTYTVLVPGTGIVSVTGTGTILILGTGTIPVPLMPVLFHCTDLAYLILKPHTIKYITS